MSDSERQNSKNQNFKICDEASVIWPFGNDDTVDNLLRLEQHTRFDIERFLKDKNIQDIKMDFTKFIVEMQNSRDSMNHYLVTDTIDHFSSKLVLRHASGRCAGILDADFDLDTATKLIIDSSMRWPIGCNSMKSVFVVESVFDKIVERLNKEFKALDKTTANPLDSNTEIGYIDEKTVLFLEKRINELKMLNLIKVLHGGTKTNPTQLTPFLISTNDFNSELLINEIPGYILCLTKVKSFKDGVDHINKLTDNNLKLAVNIDQFKVPVSFIITNPQVAEIMGNERTYYHGGSEKRVTYLLVNELSKLGTTNIIITAAPEGENASLTVDGVSEVAADGVVVVSIQQIVRSVVRGIKIQKMRNTNHMLDKFFLNFSSTGLAIEKKTVFSGPKISGIDL